MPPRNPVNSLKYCLIFFVLAGWSGIAPAHTSDWELKKNKDGIKIYTREVEGSPIHEFKGVTRVNVPIETLRRFYETPENFCRWMDRCKDSELLEKQSAEAWIMYLHLSMPWPVMDRDIVMLRTRSKDATTGDYFYSIDHFPDFYPEQAGRVRMPYMIGGWHFTPVNDNLVEISFQQHVNAGGFIPSWIANQLVVDIPYRTLSKLKKILAEELKL